MTTGFDTSGWDVEPFDAEVGFGLLPNAFLDRPSVVWCWEWYLTSSFPITFPWTFDAPPFRISTLDLYPGNVLGDVLYEARILEVPRVARTAPDVFGGVEQIDAVQLRLAATGTAPSLEPNLHTWVTAEHRGKLLIGHLVELDKNFAAVTVQQNVFRGEVTVLADDPSTVSVLARAFELATLTELVPATRVSTAWARYAPSGSLGRPVPFGIGIGRRIPCIPVHAQTDETTLFEREFTVTTATDRLSILEHELDTGRGPFQVSSTGTLPAGLAVHVDYWVIAMNEDELVLATTQGNALTGTPVDLTSTGTGTHTMRAGLAPNLAPNYELVVGSGNCGIVRVWEEESAQGATADEPVPDVPVSYTVQHKRFRPGSRYCTSIRFPDDLSNVEISADILRIYPDVDDAVVAEWKWLTSFRDDVGGFLADSTPGAPTAITTGALTATHQRYGLGGVRFDGQQSLDVLGDLIPLILETFTIELEFIPDQTFAGAAAGILTSPIVAALNAPAWMLFYTASTATASVLVVFQDGTTWTASTAAGDVPRGRPVRLALRRDGSTGKTDFFVGRTQVATDTRAAHLAYGAAVDSPFRFGVGAGATYIHGVIGWARISNIARSQRYLDGAYWLWRRNGIEFIRELATDAGRLVDGATFDDAALAWDAIQMGTLRCDGWMIDENELRAVLTAMVPFRDLALSVGENAWLQVALAQPPATIQGQFGLGDDYANLLNYPTRTVASLTEVPRSLAVRFRRPRNRTPGPFAGYAMEVRRDGLGVGKEPPPLELPFVDDPQTADQIADFRAKRMRTRDQVIDLELGHEARMLERGQAIRLNVPAMGITDLDLEAIQLAKGPTQVTMRGVATSTADFVYTPKPLPADPADRTLTALDLGNSTELIANFLPATNEVTLKVKARRVSTLLPIADSIVQFPTLVGAAKHWQAVDEGVALADDAGTYVSGGGDGLTIETFRFRGVPVSVSQSAIVSAAARMRAVSGTAVVDLMVGIDDGSALAQGAFVGSPISTAWGSYSRTLTNPFTGGGRFTLEQLNTLRVGVRSSISAIDLSAIVLSITIDLGIPLHAGYVKFWRAGPSAPAPPIPPESDPVEVISEDLGPQHVPLTGASGDRYWYYARVYDEFGRLIATPPADSVDIP